MIKDGYFLFWGGLFSNFHTCTLEFDNHTFHSSEQLFMYLKAKEFNDLEVLNKILIALLPGDAKKLGRLVNGFDSEAWDKVKEDHMLTALRIKARDCKDFRKALIATGNLTLVEASPRDNIWGIGYDQNNALNHISEWGSNLLGKCLTIVRKELKDGES